MDNTYTTNDSQKLLQKIERIKRAQAGRVQPERAQQIKGSAELIREALKQYK